MPNRDKWSGHGILRGVLWPEVRATHPNYALVLLAEAVVHGGVGIAAMFGEHVSKVWYYFGGSMGFAATGLGHLAIAWFLMLGLYWKFSIARLALLFSVTLFLLQTCLLAAGVIRVNLDFSTPQASWEGVVYSIGLVMLSIAAYREPVVPGQYTARDEGRQYATRRDSDGPPHLHPPDHDGT